MAKKFHNPISKKEVMKRVLIYFFWIFYLGISNNKIIGVEIEEARKFLRIGPDLMGQAEKVKIRILKNLKKKLNLNLG